MLLPCRWRPLCKQLRAWIKWVMSHASCQKFNSLTLRKLAWLSACCCAYGGSCTITMNLNCCPKLNQNKYQPNPMAWWHECHDQIERWRKKPTIVLLPKQRWPAQSAKLTKHILHQCPAQLDVLPDILCFYRMGVAALLSTFDIYQHPKTLDEKCLNMSFSICCPLALL